jgi:hypothetical protein
MKPKSIQIDPIGIIQAEVSQQQTGGFQESLSKVILDEKYSDYLVGLENYSHLHVIYWLSEMDETHGLHRPQSNPEVPVVGMFACR